MHPVYRAISLLGKVRVVDDLHHHIPLPIVDRAYGNIMHADFPKIVERHAQNHAQLHTHNAAVGNDGDILLMSLTRKDVVKGLLTATLDIMKAFAIRWNPFAGTGEEGLHLLRPALGNLAVAQALPITEGNLLQ